VFADSDAAAAAAPLAKGQVTKPTTTTIVGVPRQTHHPHSSIAKPIPNPAQKHSSEMPHSRTG